MDQISNRVFQALEVFTAFFNGSENLFLITVGLAIGLLAFGVLYLVFQINSQSRRRVRAAVQSASVSDSNRGQRRIESAMAPFSSIALPSSSKELSQIRSRLISAGYRRDSALSVFYFWKLVLALSLGIVALVATTFFPELTTLDIVLSCTGAAFFGSIFPSYILDKRIVERKRRIINAFPDMLDMLVACSEAGLGLNAALQRVSKEIEPSFPDLGEELELVNAEMLAGVDRIKALRGLASRTDIPEVQGFVSMLAQSVRFGTGIAETLRIYSEDFRDKRMQKAEELAAKVGTKLLFPLVLCFFPSFFLVAIGPAVISIVSAFSDF